MVETLHCLPDVSVPKRFIFTEFLNNFNTRLKRKKLYHLREYFKEIELYDWIGREDYVRENERIIDDWWYVTNVFQVACIIYIEVWNWNLLFRKKYKKQFYYVWDRQIEDLRHFEWQQLIIFLELRSGKPFDILQLLELHLFISKVAVLFLVQSKDYKQLNAL